jgi:hypothetical protein
MDSPDEAARGRAAYGLRLLGLEDAPGADPAPPEWEAWQVRREVRDGCELEGDDMTVWHDRALIPIPGFGRIEVGRGARDIAFLTTRPLSPEAVLHPGLVPAAAVVNAWKQRACVHGSAVMVDGRAWAFVADRGGGKSTTAAMLAARGHGLLTDDMLITEGVRCFAGPASVDLRGDASALLGGEFLGVIGRRERWRKPVSRGPLEAELGGLVELTWTDGAMEVTELGLGERMELVARHASMPVPPQHLMSLASLPALRVARPRDLAAADATVAALERLLASR